MEVDKKMLAIQWLTLFGYSEIPEINKQNRVKFGLSEKHTKFEKNLPHGFDKSADLLSKRQNHEEDFFKLCVLLKKSELYHVYAVLDPALNVHTV